MSEHRVFLEALFDDWYGAESGLIDECSSNHKADMATLDADAAQRKQQLDVIVSLLESGEQK